MTRVLAGIVLIAGVVGAIWLLPLWIATVLAAVVAAFAASELAGLSGVRRIPGTTPFAVSLAVSAALVCVAFAVIPPSGAPHTVFLVSMASMVAAGMVMVALGPPTRATVPWSIALMAGVYIGMPLGALGKIQFLYGPREFTVLFALLAVSDSAQYYTGRALGRHKLAPAISPAKTVEGALGGLVAAGLVGSLLGSRWIPGVSALSGTLLGVTLGALGIVGDLFESLMKRSAGVKDSSSLIPGHGGVLDRIDSWLFAAPAYYVFLRYVA